VTLGENANGGTRVRQLDTVHGKIWGTMTMMLESWSIEDVVLCGFISVTFSHQNLSPTDIGA
jgi:hypothetical protein